MATEPTPEFDLGPLSWVQGEIDQALTRGLEALAEFRANPKDATPLKHARSHVHQAAGAIQMVGLDAVVAFTDELERQLSRLEELPPAEAAAGCDVGRPRVPQAQDLPRRARERRAAGSAQALSRIRGDAGRARRQGRGADGSLLSRPDAPRAAHRAARGAAAEPPPVLPRQAAPPLPARPPRVAARRRRRRGDDARRDRGDRGRDDAKRPARVLVDRGRAVRRTGRERPRRRVRREAARRADRPADPARLRGQREGRRPAASRSAVFRRDLRPGRAAGAGGAARVQAVRPHPVRRGAVGRRRAAAAAAARGARAARRREGRVAQGRVRAAPRTCRS